MLAKAKFTMDVSSMIMKKAAPVATTGIQAVKNVECAVATTRWLRSRYALTRAAPIPCDPPVITATFCSLPIGNLLYASEGLVHERRTGCEEPVGLKLCSVDGKRISTIRQTLFRVAIECGSSPACPNAIECLSFWVSIPRSGGIMDRIDAMKVFVAALDEGSLAGAGRKLGRSPAAVRRAIAFLEAHVGAQLLHRTTRSIKVSEAGERYAVACRRVLTDLEEADITAAGERSAPRHPYLDGPLALGRSGAATDPRRLHGRLPGGVRA